MRIADHIKNGGPYRCLSLTRVFLASKTSLSIADHLKTTYVNRSTCQAHIETLKMPLTHKQPKKWWTNRQTKHSTPAAHVCARGNQQTNQTLYPCCNFTRIDSALNTALTQTPGVEQELARLLHKYGAARCQTHGDQQSSLFSPVVQTATVII